MDTSGKPSAGPSVVVTTRVDRRYRQAFLIHDMDTATTHQLFSVVLGDEHDDIVKKHRKLLENLANYRLQSPTPAT